jgi:hypothetical protein
VITNVQLRQTLSRFRCLNHRLEVECGRHAKPESVLRKDRVCRLCSLGVVEDEDHLLLVCPAHHDIRCKFGQHLRKQLTPCNLLPELMRSTNQKAIALYLVSCLLKQPKSLYTQYCCTSGVVAREGSMCQVD